MNNDLIIYLETAGYTDLVEKPNIGLCGLMRFMFTYAVVVGLDEHGYNRRYCFHTEKEARNALNNWNSETNEHPPGNWIKCKGSCNELRNPNYNE